MQYSKGFQRIFPENLLVKKEYFFLVKFVFSLL